MHMFTTKRKLDNTHEIKVTISTIKKELQKRTESR